MEERHEVTALARIPFFFFNDTATTKIYTLSLHDALPISSSLASRGLAVSRMDAASSLVRPSLSTAWVAVLMPPPVVAITPALSLMCSACHAVRWSRTTATATTATTISNENVAWPRSVLEGRPDSGHHRFV